MDENANEMVNEMVENEGNERERKGGRGEEAKEKVEACGGGSPRRKPKEESKGGGKDERGLQMEKRLACTP